MLDLLPETRAARRSRCPASTPARGRAPRPGGPADRLRAAGARARRSTGRRCACWPATASRSSSPPGRAAAARWPCTPASWSAAQALRAPQPARPFPRTWTPSSPTPPAAARGCTNIPLLFAGRAGAEAARGVRRTRRGRQRLPGRARARRPRRRSPRRCASPTTTPATWPTPRASAPSRRAACCAAIPDLTAAGDPRRRDLLRLGRHLQPRAAGDRRASSGERKAAAILATGADAVATGNIGCLTQIQTHLRALGPPAAGAAHREILDRAYAQTRGRAREQRLGHRRRRAVPHRDPVPRRARLPGRAARPLRRPPARAARRPPRAPAARDGRHAGLPAGDAGRPRGRTGGSRAPRPDYADRRVEITGPTDRKLVINALNSGARGFMADFEDANSPTWRNQVAGHANLIDAIDGTITYESSDGRRYELAATTSPRCSSAPAAGTWTRSTCSSTASRVRRAHGLRPVRRSTAAARLVAQGRGAVPLPAQARAPPRGAAVERRVRVRRGRAGPPARDDPGDRPDRDAARGVPDGRDPLRAARALLRPQRGPLGLHLLDDQVLPGPPGVRAAGPQRRQDDGPVHEAPTPSCW